MVQSDDQNITNLNLQVEFSVKEPRRKERHETGQRAAGVSRASGKPPTCYSISQKGSHSFAQPGCGSLEYYTTGNAVLFQRRG